MGITIAATSVCAVLKRHRIEPSPRRSGPIWAEFQAAQGNGLLACDFFSADTVLLRRRCVLVFIAKVGTDLVGLPVCASEGAKACDFFSVDTVLLKRLYVLVFFHYDTRLVRTPGITARPVNG